MESVIKWGIAQNWLRDCKVCFSGEGGHFSLGRTFPGVEANMWDQLHITLLYTPPPKMNQSSPSSCLRFQQSLQQKYRQKPWHLSKYLVSERCISWCAVLQILSTCWLETYDTCKDQLRSKAHFFMVNSKKSKYNASKWLPETPANFLKIPAKTYWSTSFPNDFHVSADVL